MTLSVSAVYRAGSGPSGRSRPPNLSLIDSLALALALALASLALDSNDHLESVTYVGIQLLGQLKRFYGIPHAMDYSFNLLGVLHRPISVPWLD